jgi:hypothetical protein
LWALRTSAVTDGAFAETVNGVVIGKTVNVRINDGDRDISDGADAVKAVVEIWRQKSESEIEAEIAALQSQARRSCRWAMIPKRNSNSTASSWSTSWN